MAKTLIKELISVLRSLGHNPTDNEVQDMINQVDVEGTGQIDFTEFAKFLVKLANNQGDEEEETMQLFRRSELLSSYQILSSIFNNLTFNVIFNIITLHYYITLLYTWNNEHE